VQADSRSVSGKTSNNDDTFLLRRVRPIFEGSVSKYIDFRIMPDFGGGKTELQDAWLDLKYFPEAKLQVGKFKTPFGIERLQSGTDTLFIERGLPNNLVPNRDIGAALHADLLNGKLSYAAGVFNGVADSASLDSDIDNNKELAGRIFVNPWKGGGNWLLDGLGVGFAATTGKAEGTGTSATYLPSFKTPGQATFFSYRSDALADGRHTRYSPQTYYSYGSFGLLGEYVVSEQQVRRGTASEKISNDAWQVAASYVLTGEPASYKSVVPKEPFDPQKGTWGAFEVVGRVGELNVDDDAFPAFADIASSAKSAKSWGAGLNWIWNKNVKWMIDYDQTKFEGGDSAGDREKERAILVRSQISF
jgi:phosphate-selective porin OprO/OprP